MKKRILFNIIIAVVGFIGLTGGIGCGSSSAVDGRLNLAEELMEEKADSALYILNAIDRSELRGSRIKARYALLKSMAMDKNYIDTTTFDVLQPAIDYYLKHGDVDEKLRTYYYQGVIYKNAGKIDLAMQSCLNAFDLDGLFTDSLTFARLLVAQSALYYMQYRIEEFSENNLRAADLFGKFGLRTQEIRCYGRALDGEVILLHKQKSDSIASICKSMIKKDQALAPLARQSLLIYSVNFCAKEDIIKIINEMRGNGVEDDLKLAFARAYSRIGEPLIGLQYLNAAKIAPANILDSLTYWSIKTEILENLGENKASLDAFRNYSKLLEKYHSQLFSNELLFSEKKHAMEIDKMERIQKRDRLIRWILISMGLLILVTVLTYFRYRMNKAGRLIAEGNAERLKLEGDRQRLLAEKLESEGAQLKLEAENLHLQIGQLEGEREQLKELLYNQETLSEEARQLIRERIDMLNGLFAQAITNEEKYGKEFQKYVEKIKKDKKNKEMFQQSIVKVQEATHPAFIKYLKDHGLTERELNYCCLYAIGLRGKEIGNYLDLVRHYNISSDVRRKLGLDSNGENLGPFINRMISVK